MIIHFHPITQINLIYGRWDSWAAKVIAHSLIFHCYRPQRSCEGYVFTPVCQSFCSQGGLPQCMLGCNPPEPGTPPPGSRQPPHQHPLEQTPPRTRHPPDQAPTLPADGYCCGRYASYWNAFLFQTVICFGDIISVQVFTFKLWVFMNSFLFLMPWCPRSDVDVVNAVNMNDVMSSPPI